MINNKLPVASVILNALNQHIKNNFGQLLSLSVLACFMLLIELQAASAGSKSCEMPAITGHWENSVAKPKQLKALDIIYNCPGDRRHTYDPFTSLDWVIKGWIYCRPRNCSWGRARMYPIGNGQFVAQFSTFIAIRNIKIVPDGPYLRIDIVHDFRDEKRKSVSETVRMIKKR